MRYIVDSQNKGRRLDVCAANMAGLTRSRIKLLFDCGAVRLNGKFVKGGAAVKEGDAVEVDLEKNQEVQSGGAVSKPLPENIPIKIVYEDNDLAVVDKPRGLTVHPAPGNRSGTLVNALLFRFGKPCKEREKGQEGEENNNINNDNINYNCSNVSKYDASGENSNKNGNNADGANGLSNVGGLARPGIVHRLDKMTSGLLVVAKNDAAHLSLGRQIAAKTAERTYQGIVEGVVKEDSGIIDQPLGRDTSDRKKIAVKAGGRRAVTRYKVLKRFAHNTLVEFKLETGRTHQIRAHCRFIGHPIVGDREYGFKNQRFNLPGQMLHAWRLSFDHPVTGERMSFEAELPQDMKEVLRKLTTDD